MSLLSQRKARGLALGLALGSLALMLALPNPDPFSTVALVVLAWANVGLIIWSLRHLPEDLPDRRILHLLAWSSILWALGESLWAVYFFLGVEADPSWADLFWIPGSLVFLYALWRALRTYPRRRLPRLPILHVVLVGIALGLIGYLVIWPIFQELPSTPWLQVLWALAYPLIDTALLITALTLAVYMARSQLWRAWTLIAASVLVASLADLAYAYLDWNGLYYAETTEGISRLTDWLFLLDYILYGWGIYELYLAWRGVAERLPQVQQPPDLPLDYANVFGLLYLDANDRIIGSEGPFWQKVGTPQENQTLAEALRLDPAQVEPLLAQLHRQHKILPTPLELRTPEGEPLMAYLSGVAVMPGTTYLGANLILRTFVPGHEPLEGLSEEGVGMVTFLARETGFKVPDYRQAMLRYTQAVWQTLMQAIAHQLGPQVAQGILERLAAAHGNVFNLNLREVAFTQQAASDPHQEQVRLACAALIEDLFRTAQQLLSEPLALYELFQAERRLEAEVLQIAKELGLRPQMPS